MKSSSSVNVRWNLALWFSFLAFVAIFAFGAAVDVGFNDPSVPFAQAWASVRWDRALPDPRAGEYHLVFAAAVVGLVCHSIHQSWKFRFGTLVAAFLAPVFTIGIVMLCMPVLAPWMIWDALIGKVDGEFYSEDTVMIAAVGLWMGVCLVFALKELWFQKPWSKNSYQVVADR